MTASPKAWPECSSSATGWRRLDRSGSRRADPHAPGATEPVPQRRKRRFGPDGRLYVSLGELNKNASLNAQRTDEPMGSILRYNADGSIPVDNPLGVENPIWVYGLRNPFGFTFDPDDGALWIADNGPAGHDRVLRMDAGENAGWPFVRGLPTNPIERVAAAVIGDRFRSAVWESYDTRVAPTRSSSCAIMRMAPRWTGDFSSASTIRDASCSSSSTRPGRGSRAPARSWRTPGGITDLELGPDERLYVLPATHLYRVDPRSSSPTAPGGGDSRRHGEPRAVGIEWARTVEDQRATADRRSIQP